MRRRLNAPATQTWGTAGAENEWLAEIAPRGVSTPVHSSRSGRAHRLLRQHVPNRQLREWAFVVLFAGEHVYDRQCFGGLLG